MEKIKAKKSLGQNFLTDQSVLADIAKAISPKAEDLIVEVGPGHGELTNYLLASGARVIAIEKDRALASELRLKYKALNLQVIDGDALDVIRNLKLEIRNSASWKLVGNIPYYITGQLFRIMGELEHKPSLVVFTIQKEVAERICAGPGKMNILAASIQIWAEPEIISIIDKTKFNPIPKVDSATIRLTVKQADLSSNELRHYYELLHIVFKQPRKTIWNNLKPLLESNQHGSDDLIKLLSSESIDPTSRPHNLNTSSIINLTRRLYF